MAGAGYLLFTAGQVLTAVQVNTYLNQQSVMVFATSAARDAALTTVKSEGMVTYQLDNNDLDIYNGASFSTLIAPAHGVLTPWTPTVTQSVSVTVTNTSSFSIRIARYIVAWFNLAVTGTGTIANAIQVSIPVTATAGTDIRGTGEIFDNSVAHYPGMWVGNTSTSVVLYGWAQTNAVGAAPSFATVSPDTIAGVVYYPAAADG